MRLRNPILWLLLAIAFAAGWQQWRSQQHLPAASQDSSASQAPTQPAATDATVISDPPAGTSPALPAFLPREARTTITLIHRGGPYPYRQDGQVFGNREGLLPRQPRGWYREYTVDTPGLRHRGARRIVTGGNPPREWYYSDDHYRSFRSFHVGLQP
ncbi:ribonuclease domain-containing protein [Thermomonas fusca]